jgi:hypothetical protein
MQSTIGVSVVLRKKNVKKGKVRHTHSGIIAGKLNGHIPTHTPSGSLMLKVSIPLETFDTYIHPSVVFPIPQACSTTSTGLGVQNQQPVHLAYQPPASSTFLSEQTSHQQPASSTFLSE